MAEDCGNGSGSGPTGSKKKLTFWDIQDLQKEYGTANTKPIDCNRETRRLIQRRNEEFSGNAINTFS
jgi:hypothetical protein